MGIIWDIFTPAIPLNSHKTLNSFIEDVDKLQKVPCLLYLWLCLYKTF